MTWYDMCIIIHTRILEFGRRGELFIIKSPKFNILYCIFVELIIIWISIYLWKKYYMFTKHWSFNSLWHQTFWNYILTIKHFQIFDVTVSSLLIWRQTFCKFRNKGTFTRITQGDISQGYLVAIIKHSSTITGQKAIN